MLQGARVQEKGVQEVNGAERRAVKAVKRSEVRERRGD